MACSKSRYIRISSSAARPPGVFFGGLGQEHCDSSLLLYELPIVGPSPSQSSGNGERPPDSSVGVDTAACWPALCPPMSVPAMSPSAPAVASPWRPDGVGGASVVPAGFAGTPALGCGGETPLGGEGARGEESLRALNPKEGVPDGCRLCLTYRAVLMAGSSSTGASSREYMSSCRTHIPSGVLAYAV